MPVLKPVTWENMAMPGLHRAYFRALVDLTTFACSGTYCTVGLVFGLGGGRVGEDFHVRLTDERV